MRNTLLTQRRREAPGRITTEVVSAFFTRRRYPRSAKTISAFENAQFVTPPERFLELWSACIGCPVDETRELYRLTSRARGLGTGPFGRTRVA